MTSVDNGSGENLPEDGVPASGSEADPAREGPRDGSSPGPHGPRTAASGAGSQESTGDDAGEDGLTVEDILDAAQTGAAAAEHGEQVEEESPYLEDLRRLTAEYANYRKRTEANSALEKQRAVASVVMPLLGVLDDLDRAEKHGDLDEGTAFAAIAQKIRSSLERLGLESFGVAGEPFDPAQHEAIAQVPTPGTEQDTVLDVVERGYRIGEVELRPAKVAVAVGADG